MGICHGKFDLLFCFCFFFFVKMLQQFLHLEYFPDPYHLPELAGQSVNRMRHFEGMVLQNHKNRHSENSTRYLQEIRRTKIKLNLKIGTFRLRTDLSGQFLQMESTLKSQNNSRTLGLKKKKNQPNCFQVVIQCNPVHL